MASLKELQRQRDRIVQQLGRMTQRTSVDGTLTEAPNMRDQLAALEEINEMIAEEQSQRPWLDLVMTPPGPIGDFS